MLRPPYSQLCLLIVLVVSCVSPYEPPPINHGQQFLVVDAFLNTTDRSATVSLRYTTPLDSKEEPVYESSAVVTIRDEDDVQTLLTNHGNGTYGLSGIDVGNGKKYSLRISTSTGGEYQSQYIEAVQTPAIDSLSFLAGPDKIFINVNTHDPSGNSRYYRWFCTETFEYRTVYFSGLNIYDGVVTPKTADQFIDKCWRTDLLHDINIRSTASLNEDRVSNFTLRAIARGDIRISQKYSLFVQQQTLTEEAFQYWKSVKQTTETLGGLFDPVPSQVIGNIQSVTNPDEPVIGFFSAGSVTQKRIFISRANLPRSYPTYNHDCVIDTIFLDALPSVSNPHALLYPFYDGPSVIGYATTSTDCFDCRVLGGGTTTRPDFWE